MLDFDTLYREYAPRVHRFVLGLSGNPATAEDVTAETFVRVWATRDSVRHETVRAFLFTIARNLWLQGIRSDWRRDQLDEAGRDPAPGPDVRAADRLALNRVLEALASIDAGDRGDPDACPGRNVVRGNCPVVADQRGRPRDTPDAAQGFRVLFLRARNQLRATGIQAID